MEDVNNASTLISTSAISADPEMSSVHDFLNDFF